MKDGYMNDGYFSIKIGTGTIGGIPKGSPLSLSGFQFTSEGHLKSEKSPKHTRININLPTETVEYLKAQSEETYVTMTGLILNAIQLSQVIKQWTKEGKRLMIKNSDESTQEIIFLS